MPPFLIEEAAASGWVAVTCGRKKCQLTFYVKRGQFLHGASRNYLSRMCPYCSKAGTIHEKASQ